jgi:anti-sigma regulatory factor (Ser/Thr protein kinase)
MAEKPPYLFDPGDAEIAVTSDIDGAVIDMVMHGEWRDPLRLAVAAAIAKVVALCPAGLVVDLTGLDDERAESAPAWVATARDIAVVSPGTRLALCVPPGRELGDKLRTAGLAVYASGSHARTALSGGGQLTDVIRLRLPPAPESASLARNLLGGACQEWGLPSLLHPGRAVLSELVTNAVEHARTEMDISISRRGAGLHLAVRDRNPLLPRVRELAPVLDGRPLDDRGRGLRVVDADSIAWGAISTAGGKMVWATVRDREGRPRRW